MTEESKSVDELLEEQITKLCKFSKDFEKMQEDLRQLNIITSREIMITKKILYDFSHSFSKKTQEEFK